MISEETQQTMDSSDRKALAQAVRLLERQSLASRLADMAGQPVNNLMKQLPAAVTEKLRDVVTAAMLQSLKAALSTLDAKSGAPASWWIPKLMTGVSGGISGFFGIAALAIELPITTTMMLRSIADIARSEGEDLRSARTRLACLEVFALGGHGQGPSSEAGYYVARAMMAKAMSEAASFLLERGVVEETAPALLRLVAEIASRFGIVVSEKLAAGAAPVFGALGGATINVAFTDHFQNVARGHFIIRRLERKYGAERVRLLYAASV